jgi:hypothetical protein
LSSTFPRPRGFSKPLKNRISAFARRGEERRGEERRGEERRGEDVEKN